MFIILIHEHYNTIMTFFPSRSIEKYIRKSRNLAYYFSILKIFQSNINNIIDIVNVLILPLLLILSLFYYNYMISTHWFLIN